NPDRFGHLRWLSSQAFTWEDLLRGGDRDFNDLTVGFRLETPQGSPLLPVPLPLPAVPSGKQEGPPPSRFPHAPGDWQTSQSGGSPAGRGTATLDNFGATLREGDSFQVTLRHSFTVPAGPSSLRFGFEGPAFDTTAHGMKDAFEAALVDADGRPLVHSF